MAGSRTPLRACFFASLLLTLLIAGQAVAASMEEDGCRNERKPAILVVYCTKLIQSGQLAGAKLAWAYVNRGWAYRLQEKDDLAMADFDTALNLDPKDVDALYERGNVYLHRKDYGKAIADYDAAIQLRPGAAGLWDNRGMAYHESGQYERAIKDYDEAIRLNPKDYRALNNRGQARRNMGKYDLAIQDYDAALGLKPDYIIALINRAYAYLKSGQYEQALADYNSLVQKNPDDAEALNNRCWTFVVMHRAREGLGDCDRSLSLQPKAYTFDSRGFAHLQLGDLAAAIADFDKAVELDPHKASSLFGRGKVEELQGDKLAAARDYAAARAIQSDIEADLVRKHVLEAQQ